MKMEEQNQFDAEIKILYKKFRVLDRPSTKILYEFCEFDAIKAYKILALASTMRDPAIIIQVLIKHPQKSQQFIDSLIHRYDKQINDQIDIFVQKTTPSKTKQNIESLQFQFFQQIPDDTISNIMSYLDPYSFKSFTFCNTIFYNIGRTESLSQFYKQICKTIFASNEPKLPLKCRFEQIKLFVEQNPLQFYPYYQNFKNAVTNNLRRYIWKHSPADFKIQTKYYKSFNSYQNLFEKCPRINFNGFYICKHKYVKIGEKETIHAITPIHIIYYYRYLRFLEDGSVIFYVSNRKIKPQDILKFLSKQILDQQPSKSIVGEFMQHKQIVYVKTCTQNSVFCYDIQIRSTQGKISNELSVLEYKLELIDKSYMTQTLYKSGPYKEELIFNYSFNEQIRKQNSPRIQSCGL